MFNKLKLGNVDNVVIQGMDEHRDFFRLLKSFCENVERFNPDYVTVHTNWQLAIAVVAKHWRRYDYSLLYILHGYRHNYRVRSIVAKCVIGAALLFFADDVIMPSSFLKKQFSFLGKKNKIIFIGEDEAFFQDYPLPTFSGTKRFVFAAEFRTGKNQDLLIRALKRYIDASGDRDIELHLPGKGNRLADCKQLCRQLDIEDKVIFPGFLDRAAMLELYLKSQFALVSSNVETFGHCIVEPFLLGRVVITRHVGVADDIIIAGETGFFFDGEDDLVELLLKISLDQALCTNVSENAYKKRDLFRWETVCQQHFTLIYDRPRPIA